MPNNECYEITVEAPSEGFQLMKDSLDLRILMRTEQFKPIVERTHDKLKDPKTIFDYSRKLNKELVGELNKITKIRKAQISRVFDILMLAAVDRSDASAMAAYEGFLRKKVQRLSGQLLFTTVNEKYLEYEGRIEKVNYSLFASKDPELDKKFDEIFMLTLTQYKSVVNSIDKYQNILN